MLCSGLLIFFDSVNFAFECFAGLVGGLVACAFELVGFMLCI